MTLDARLLAAVAMILSAPVAADQVIVRHELSAAQRMAAAQAAQAACATDGAQVAVAITDSAGIIRTLIGSDDVPAFSIEMAMGKARTAAALRTDTAALVEIQAHAPDFAAVLRRHEPALTLLGGGLVVRRGGEFVGAIGVGGADRPAKDEACARAGIAAIAAQLG